jgi:hypothetical protein
MAGTTKGKDPAAEQARLAERVLIEHPDVPSTKDYPVDVSRRQLEVVYVPRGWREAKNQDAVPAGPNDPPADQKEAGR